jgi:hypothetical protein
MRRISVNISCGFAWQGDATALASSTVTISPATNPCRSARIFLIAPIRLPASLLSRPYRAAARRIRFQLFRCSRRPEALNVDRQAGTIHASGAWKRTRSATLPLLNVWPRSSTSPAARTTDKRTQPNMSLQSAKSDARKIQFSEQFQPDLGRPVFSAKIIRFPLPPNQWLFPRVSSRQEGRIAIVTNARRDVVDAAASGV